MESEIIEKHLIHIRESLDRIESKINNLSDNANLKADGDEILDNQDVMQMLKINYRTLQRYRTNRVLPYSHLNGKQGKIIYKKADILKFKTDLENGDLNKNLRNKK